uniref:Uncharacterized protein n=1 Tax=Tanacetum cinerariifolium TaxID=118510 RepID=A0A6L2LTU6_TANCI|nr:hypothetical protein [Tanacetum cinerariifolium]
MTSFGYRLNPLFPIKECSSCGALYTTDNCCSEGSLGDKIICDLDQTPNLSQRSPQNCPKCGNPVDDHYCQGCALLRKKFKEDLFTYCIENGILQDSTKPSNNNTNVANALREPFVGNQDPSKNSSQSPPQINHHCCYECGDALEDIYCHQCTCKLCGRGAHYGYNCPPKVLVVPNLKPFNNQTVDELPQTLPCFDPTFYSEDGNSFTYDSTSNFFHDSPNFPVIHQPIHEKTCAELLTEEQEANIDTQPFQYSVVPQPPQEELSVKFLREKRNQMDSVKTFLRKFNQISFYELPKVLSLAWETILEIELAFEDKHFTPSLSTKEPDNSLCMGDEHLDTVLATESDEFIKSSFESLVSIPSESEGILDSMCDVPFHDTSPPLDVSKDQFEYFSDSNDESTSTDDDSFSIDNIEYVKASPPNSELVSSELMEIVIPKVGGIDDDILLTIKDNILCEKLLNINLLFANIEALNDNPTPSFDFMTNSGSTTTCFDISLPDYEAVYDNHVKEISSGSTTTHSSSSLYDSFIFDLSINPCPPADRSNFHEFADELSHIISLLEYDCFHFKIEPNSGDFTMDMVEDTFPTREPRVHNALPTHPTFQLNLDFILSSESLFTYVVWIFLFSLIFSCSSISSILRE